jgi:hypothetical protein
LTTAAQLPDLFAGCSAEERRQLAQALIAQLEGASSKTARVLRGVLRKMAEPSASPAG